MVALAADESIGKCADIDDDAARLACYDRAAGRSPASPSPSLESPRRSSVEPGEAQTQPNNAVRPTMPVPPESAVGPSLSKVWELDAADKLGTFRLVPHKLNYLLPVRWTTRTNTLPSSPAPDHGVGAALPIDSTEAKFQISLKFKAAQNLFGDNGDLWFGYTQQSNWQLYNGAVSSPFRETDYEPEAILALRTDGDLLGWRWRSLNLGLVHQSNGRPLPVSRNWNRVYAQFGLERGDFTLLARPWIRVPEKADKDDNPDIRDYLGSGDLRLAYASAGQVYSLLGRYSFSGRRGALQFEWAYPIAGALKGYVQLTSGYGETLVDYNHSQNTIGIGLLFVPWQ
ncbi:MAG: phospholipase A [Burkholderiaceae bacterium]